MKLPSLTQIAKSQAKFLRFYDHQLWYELTWTDESECVRFVFPIPVNDSGAGEFLPDMRGIEVLRWARKHVEYLQASEPL